MKHAPCQRGVEGLPLFQRRIRMFAPSLRVREDLGYGPDPRRKERQEFLSADDVRDEELARKSRPDPREELIFGLPENQRPVTDEEIAEILGPLKEFLADSTSRPR